MFGVSIFILLNLITLSSAYLAAGRLAGLRSRPDIIIGCFLFYFAQIVLTQLVLGFTGALYLKNVFLLNLAVFIFIWGFCKSKKPDLKHVREDAVSVIPPGKAGLFGLVVLAGFGLVKVLINLYNPPFGWDSLNYHFTFPVEWLKSGNLDMPITICDDPSPPYYPINASLFYLWHIFPFGSVFMADLGQLPFFILAGLSVYAICRKIDLSRPAAFFAVVLFLLIPNFFKQLEIAYADVMAAALFLAGLNCLFLLRDDFSLKNSLLYGLALGLFLGTKTVALPYTALLFIPFLYFILRNPGKLRLLLPAITLIIVFGGFSYLRNFCYTGNPLYPFELKIMGREILKGVMDKATYAARFRAEDYSFAKMLFHEGLGVQSLLLVLPGIFSALPLSLLKRRRPDPFLIYFTMLPALIFLVYRFVIPLANMRYLYAFLGMGIILGFYSAKLLNIPESALKIIAVICVLASIPELASHAELISGLALCALLFYAGAKKIRFNTPAIVISAGVLIIGLGILSKNYKEQEFSRYIKMEGYSGFWPGATRAWDWLNRNTTGNNIAYVGRPVPFPLYGENFKNNVFYVSVNTTDPAKLHYFSGSSYRWGLDALSMHQNFEAPGNYRAQASYPAWLINLKRRKTDYLFIYSLHHTREISFPMEDAWAKNNPGIFHPVFSNETAHIYKLSL